MAQDILQFLIDIVFQLFGIGLILRAWMFAIRLHPFNPFSQAILRATDWLVQPIRRIVPGSGRFDWPSILACWITAVLYLLLTWLVAMGAAAHHGKPQAESVFYVPSVPMRCGMGGSYWALS